jgi:hypothetical protein
MRVVIGVAVVVLLGLVAFGSSSAAAQERPEFDVSVSLQPRAATLGEHVQLVVTVRHGQDLLVSSDQPARAADIELVATTSEVLVFDDPIDGTPGMATTTFEYTIAAYQLGDLHPGVVDVSWLATDGSTGSTTVAPPILRILPVRVVGDEELRPLKPQASAGSAPAWWQRSEVPIGLGVLALALVALVLWGRLRSSGAPVAVLEEVRSPEDLARARLDQLRSAALADRDQYRRFYGELSLVVRSYLEARYAFNATALTTAELKPRFDETGVGRWQARLVSGLLERCDAAVYARARPDPASADHDLTVAYEIVELSRPRRSDPLEAVSA